MTRQLLKIGNSSPSDISVTFIVSIKDGFLSGSLIAAESESKIEDVEEGLQDFQRNVDVVENRIKSLVQGEQKNGTSWFSWAGRKFGRF